MARLQISGWRLTAEMNPSLKYSYCTINLSPTLCSCLLKEQNVRLYKYRDDCLWKEEGGCVGVFITRYSTLSEQKQCTEATQQFDFCCYPVVYLMFWCVCIGKWVELSKFSKVALCQGLTVYFLFWEIWEVLCIFTSVSMFPISCCCWNICLVGLFFLLSSYTFPRTHFHENVF